MDASPAASPSASSRRFLFANVQNPGAADMVLLAASPSPSCSGGARPWPSTTAAAGSTPARAAPADDAPRARRRRLVVGAAVAFAAVCCRWSRPESSQTFLFSRMLIFALVALSVTVLTGWAGQLSLGQFAFVGLGAMTTARWSSRGMPFGAAVVYATVAVGARRRRGRRARAAGPRPFSRS